MNRTSFDKQAELSTLCYENLLTLGKEIHLTEELELIGCRVSKEHYNQRLILTDAGEIVALPNRTTHQLHKAWLRLPASSGSVPNRKTFTQAAKLLQIKKIKYRPVFEPVIASGVAHGYFHDTSVGFYRAVHADTQPVLSISALWFAVPAFTAFLEKHLIAEGLHTSFDQINKCWVSKERRIRPWEAEELSTYRELLHGGSLSLEFDEESQKYVAPSDKRHGLI
jgi:hypothetical protein